MNQRINIISIALLMSFSFAHGMKTEPEHTPNENITTQEAGNFTNVPDEIIHIILECLCKHLPINHQLDAFEDRRELANFKKNKVNLNHFSVTCRWLSQQSKSYILENRTILNNLLLTTLNSDTIRHNSKSATCYGERINSRVEKCLETGADVNCLHGFFKKTPLILAIENCPHDEVTIQALINNGAHLNHITLDNKTPLHYAVQNRPYLVQLLIGSGAHMLPENSGSLLSAAIQAKNISTVELCIKHNVDVNKLDEYGNTPLYNCVLKIDDRHNYNATTWTDAQEDYHNIAQLLIQHGANVNQANDEGETPLYQAVLNDRIEIVELLIANGANVNQAIKDGETPLYRSACYNTFTCNGAKIIKLLIEHGANVDHAINLANTLGKQCWLGSERIIDQIMEVNAQMKATILPDDYDSDDDSSSSSARESDPIILPQQPHIPDPTLSSVPQDLLHNNGIFNATLNSMRANPLATFSGVVVISGICYWAYKKYQAYTATQKETDQNEKKNEEAANQIIEQIA